MTWFSRYSPCGAKRAGKADGKMCIPKWDSDVQAPYVQELGQAADQNIRNILQAWHECDQSLQAKVEQLEHDKNDAQDRKNTADHELKQAEDTYKSARHSPPPVGGDARLIGYWLLVLVLFLGEFPINLVVFRLFGESELWTAVGTVVLGVPLLGCAHFLGRKIKESHWTKERIVMMIALIIAPILAFFVVGWARQWYLSKVSPMPGDTQPPGTMFTFAVFNLIIFVVATVASFYAHDELLCNVYRARKQQAKADQKLLAADKAYSRAQVRRLSVFRALHAKAKQKKDIVQQLINVYQTTNLRVRPDKTEPHKDPVPLSFMPENHPSIAKDALDEFDKQERKLRAEIKARKLKPK